MKRPLYLTALLVILATVFSFGTAYAATIQNDFVSVNIGNYDGRYNFGLKPPGAQNWYNISYAWPSSPGTSFTTIKIDGTNYIYGSNGFVTPPTNRQDVDGKYTKNDALWRQGDISVQQVLTIVDNPSTSNKDAAEIRYIITNTGDESHNVGIRVMIDTMLNGNDSSPFKIPTPSGMLSTNQEQNYTGNNVPDFWQGFYDLDNPNISAQWTLRGGEAVVPDRLAIANWGSITGTEWDYTTTPNRYTGDSAVGIWWNAQTIAPGDTKTIVTYYGMPRVVGSRKLTVSSPSTLPHSEWSQRPFNLVAYINNTSANSYNDVFVTVDTGLNLVDNDPVHNLGNISANGNSQTTWRLQPPAAGNYTVRVNAYHTVNGIPELIDSYETQIEAIPPAVPENIEVSGSAGTTPDGTPVSGRLSPMTVHGDFPDAISVELVATDSNNRVYRAQMTHEGTDWVHTFVPSSVGLWGSPLRVELIPHYADGSTGAASGFNVVLIDPSGFVYNDSKGEEWKLPGAQVILQYFDPVLRAWVNMNNSAYPDRMSPVNNPQITDSDGRYAWDVAEGRYRVMVSRRGFAPVTSREVDIPPAVTDLNVGLTPTDSVYPTVVVNGITNNANYTEPVTVELAADDEDSGLRKFTYSIDGGQETVDEDGNVTQTISNEGGHSITYTAVDYAGNEMTNTVSFTIGSATPVEPFEWLGLLNDENPSFALNTNNVISFRNNEKSQVDKSVTVRIRNVATNKLIVGYTFNAGITYDEANNAYSQNFNPTRYRLTSGTQLKVMVYFGGKVIDTKIVNIN